VEERIYTVETHGPKISGFLNKVIELGGLDLSFDVEVGENPHPEYEDPELVVRFKGPDVDVLLANKAEGLLALEYLTMEALRIPHDHHERLCFDANDSRMLRIAELRLSAQTAAEKVKRSKLPFRFSPMTSRERRIIHLALRNETGVRSESAGLGPARQVIIYPAGMPSLPDSAITAPPRRKPPMGGPGGGREGGGDRGRDRGDRGGRGPRDRDRGRRRDR
jgi:spoIIIJ-associated protein